MCSENPPQRACRWSNCKLNMERAPHAAAHSSGNILSPPCPQSPMSGAWTLSSRQRSWTASRPSCRRCGHAATVTPRWTSVDSTPAWSATTRSAPFALRRGEGWGLGAGIEEGAHGSGWLWGAPDLDLPAFFCSRPLGAGMVQTGHTLSPPVGGSLLEPLPALPFPLPTC